MKEAWLQFLRKLKYRWWDGINVLLVSRWGRPIDRTLQAIRATIDCPAAGPMIREFVSIYPDYRFAMVMSLAERQQKALDDATLTYGESRWTAFIRILKHVYIQPTDVFIDLGCGSGWLCFYAQLRYGITAIGIDRIGYFIHNGNKMAQRLGLDKVSFIESDLFDADISQGTIFYATCTCFPIDYLNRLAERLKDAPMGAQIVTITHPLRATHLELQQVFTCLFSWGLDTVWIHTRV